MASGQTPPVHVTVVDATGAPIAGARVVATPATGAPLAIVTDQRGDAQLTVAPGSVVIEVTADHFQALSRTVVVGPQTTGAISFALQVTGIRETTFVTASAGYRVDSAISATKSLTLLRDTPQAVTVVNDALMRDQLMTSVGDVVRYMPGVSSHQGENNRDQVIVRGNSSSADFFINGVRDDVQYYRDLYNVDRVEALMGPNAMIFGRGGGGGVINRVTKEAGFDTARQVTLQGGESDHGRVSLDLNQPLSKTVAVRFTGVYENSGSFRTYVDLRRHGLSPTVTFAPRQNTRVVVRYEHLEDTRVADRGITSVQGRPANVDIRTFYGNPDDSHVRAGVHIAAGTIEHRRGRFVVRNHTVYGDYDRFYQNYVPGAASTDGSQVTLTAYNNATSRRNTFNQTDVTVTATTGGIRHTLLGGADVGRQLTGNVRNTGFFNNTSTSLLVPFLEPRTSTPVTYRQSATDADNHLRTTVAAAYAQDQLDVTAQVKAIIGLRFDRFDLTYFNHRTGDVLRRTDDLVSPRAGLVYKPIEPVSVYSSYSVSHLPSSGDQFSSLTTITQQVEPEKFTNVEGGVKWDLRSGLAFSTAIYQLDRMNTRATDPNDPTRIVQTGSQRTRGTEIGVTGRVTAMWSIAGGYAYQNAVVTSATAAARVGAAVGQVPHHTFSLWNSYQITRRASAALGLSHRATMFATIDNSVTLPGYTRADLGVFYSVNSHLRVQLNIENISSERYYANADSNTNISPGVPRSVRLGFTTRF